MAWPHLPNYSTNTRGKKWTVSLRAAERAGAKIFVEETGERVRYQPNPSGTYTERRKPWVDRKGQRHESRDCAPLFDY